MSISDRTKSVVAGEKSRLQAKYKKLAKDKAEAEAQVVSITARMEQVKADYDALDADIPEPEVRDVRDVPNRPERE